MNTMISSILIASIQIISASSLSANTISDEGYVDDIPFNTTSIVKSYLKSEAFFMNMHLLLDESYVNDIPFNTGEIVANHANVKPNGTLASLPDEAYVDDIPFSTEQIALSSLVAEKILCNSRNQSDEPYANDIPFETSGVVAALNTADENLTDLNTPLYISQPMQAEKSPVKTPKQLHIRLADVMIRCKANLVNNPDIVSVIIYPEELLKALKLSKEKVFEIQLTENSRETLPLHIEIDDVELHILQETGTPNLHFTKTRH